VEEATTTETGNSATSAKSRATDKRNAGNRSRRTNHAETHKDELTSQESTSWTRTRTQKPSTPSTTKMSRVCNKDSAFNIVGIQYNSRTAALPQQFSGFQ
jgi:hypothetical protein